MNLPSRLPSKHIPKIKLDFSIHSEGERDRRFFDNLEKELQLQSKEEWYQFQRKDIVHRGGKDILKRYGSLHQSLKFLYPEYDWRFWKFAIHNSSEFWRQTKNQRLFLDDAFVELKLKSWEQWYDVKRRDITLLGGKPLLLLHKNSLPRTLLSVYPEHKWQLWRFKHEVAPNGFWSDKRNQLDFFENLKKEMNIKEWEDWYKISYKDIYDRGGHGLMVYYNCSPLRALQAVYPQYDFQQFPPRAAVGYWRDLNRQRELMNEIGEKLNIRTWSDWYGVQTNHVAQCGGQPILKLYGTSLAAALKSIFPEYAWRFEQTPQKKSEWWKNNAKFLGKAHLRMYEILQSEIFGEVSDVFVNYLHPSFTFTESKNPMEFDVFIPSLKLCFEYHGEQHFSGAEDELLQRQRNKEEKRSMCRQHDITMIEIPYWWNGTKEQLLATIKKYRPELVIFTGDAEPVPSERPKMKPGNRAKN
eukprot:TRINITY_DN1649_c1_g4_i2.p1 TRINITY_DN1649_c1_g4~~TRINITY_DN1649_c1_g4_i2.p1  ORF type:complete len:470 (+),score=99.43 TRINITY_DN1649_c1_g4_i2:214-1623(+)